MRHRPNTFLVVGGALSALAALLHLGCIAFGAPWYRFFGAGEQMARLAASGSPYPALVTTVIAVVLLAWSLIAFSGAGLVRKLPLLRTGLLLVTAIYLVRGAAVLPLMRMCPAAAKHSGGGVRQFASPSASSTWLAFGRSGPAYLRPRPNNSFKPNPRRGSA